MTTISKRDALQLAADVRRCMVAGHAIAARRPSTCGDYLAGFVGGLSETLRAFVARHAGYEAAAAIAQAFEYEPTQAEIEAHNAEMAALLADIEARRRGAAA